jgi:hypothetical protein
MNTNARAAVTPAKAGVYEEAHDPKMVALQIPAFARTRFGGEEFPG